VKNIYKQVPFEIKTLKSNDPVIIDCENAEADRLIASLKKIPLAIRLNLKTEEQLRLVYSWLRNCEFEDNIIYAPSKFIRDTIEYRIIPELAPDYSVSLSPARTKDDSCFADQPQCSASKPLAN
jgi:hypothetical protein